MQKLLNQIKDDAKKKKIRNKNIASAIRVSEGMVTNYFKMTNRIPFFKFVLLVQFIYEDDWNAIDKLMVKFIQQATRTESMLEAAEWFYNHCKRQLLEQLLERNKEESQLDIYRLQLKRSQGNISKEEVYLEIEQMKRRGDITKEMNVLIQIFNLYSFIDFRSINMIPFVSKEALTINDQIGNEYLKKSYQFRILESVACSELRKNNVKGAEEIALSVVHDPENHHYPLSTNYMLNLLAECYIFIDADKSMEYSAKALSHFHKNHLHENLRRLNILKATSDFIKIHHQRFENLFLEDPAEQAHFFSKLDTEESRNKAKELLNGLNKKNNGLSPHQKYYLAMATKDLNDMKESLDAFVGNGDLYYANLPRTYASKIFL